jgi:hypothetical protein
MARLSKRGSGIGAVLIVLGLAGVFGAAKAALPEHPRQAAQPIMAPPASGIQLTRVQLGAWRTAIEAAKGWDRIQKRAAGTMDGLSPRVVPANLPGRGTFYRLWIGPVLKASAGRFCARLQARHIDCIPAPTDMPAAVPRSGVYQANESP